MKAMTVLAVFALACVSACKTDRITTVDPAVTANEDVWSGGTLVLRSPSFTGADSTPIVTVGAETLAVRRLGPDSVLVQIPDTDGLLTLTVGLRTGGRSLVQVRVHGVSAAGAGPSLSNADPQIYPWPGNGNPTALALDRGRLVLVDFGRHTVSPLTADTGLGCGADFLPVPSATTSLVAVARRAPSGFCGLVAIPTAQSSAAPDTGPDYGYYSAVHLARGKWLVGGYKGQGLFLLTKDAAGGFTSSPGILTEPGFGFTLSPRGDRVVPSQYYWVPAGVPVFDVSSAAVAFSLPLPLTWSAAFTQGGDTLFVTGQDSAYNNALEALDATSGVLLAKATLQGDGFSVAVDLARPWVYVAGLEPNGPYVEVFDRSLRTRVTTLRPSASMLRGFDPRSSWYDYWPTLVLSPVTRRVYLVFMTVPTYVFEFDLMP